MYLMLHSRSMVPLLAYLYLKATKLLKILLPFALLYGRRFLKNLQWTVWEYTCSLISIYPSEFKKTQYWQFNRTVSEWKDFTPQQQPTQMNACANKLLRFWLPMSYISRESTIMHFKRFQLCILRNWNMQLYAF